MCEYVCVPVCIAEGERKTEGYVRLWETERQRYNGES